MDTEGLLKLSETPENVGYSSKVQLPASILLSPLAEPLCLTLRAARHHLYLQFCSFFNEDYIFERVKSIMKQFVY